MPAVAFDVRQPDLIAHEIGEAQQRLAREREVPDSVRHLVEDLAEAFSQIRAEQLEQIDPYLLIGLQGAALAGMRALRLDDLADERRRLRVSLEQMRHVFRDMEAAEPISQEIPASEIARWLVDRLQVPQRELAELVGVEERTFQRWSQQKANPRGDEARRLRLIARSANHLRHALTGPGVVRWFTRPRSDLGGQRPIDVLDDPDAVGRLTTLAAGTRSSSAS